MKTIGLLYGVAFAWTAAFTPQMGSSAAIPTGGLIGYWPGNGNAYDLSTNGNNGNFGGRYVPGSPFGGLAFDVGSAKVVMGNISAYNLKGYNGYTVGFWFCPNSTPISGNNGLFLGQDSGSGYKPKWFVDYGYTVYGIDNCYHFHVNDWNTERIFVSSQSEASPTNWQQLTIIVDNVNNGLVSFYLNGQPIGTAAMGNYVLETSAALVFGQAEGLSYNGYLAHVAMYDRVLSTNEISQLVTPSSTTAFSIINEKLDGQGNIAITWQSTPGAVYQVVSATSLAKPIQWKNAGAPVIATGTTTTLTVPASSNQLFFAVVSP